MHEGAAPWWFLFWSQHERYWLTQELLGAVWWWPFLFGVVVSVFCGAWYAAGRRVEGVRVDGDSLSGILLGGTIVAAFWPVALVLGVLFVLWRALVWSLEWPHRRRSARVMARVAVSPEGIAARMRASAVDLRKTADDVGSDDPVRARIAESLRVQAAELEGFSEQAAR